MKRFVKIILFTVTSLLLLSSCSNRRHGTCPAYGKILLENFVK